MYPSRVEAWIDRLSVGVFAALAVLVIQYLRVGCEESSMSKVRQSLPVAERLLLRFKDAAREAQMSTQRATNEALKAWIASRPAEEQRGVAIKASLRALAASVKQKQLARRAERRTKQESAPKETSGLLG